jgi:hypothetical protein
MTQVKLQRQSSALASGAKVRLDRSGGKPVFASLMGDAPSEPMPSPLADLAYPDTVEGNALIEAQRLREAFQEKYRGELDAFRTLDDPNYWFLVCFQNTSQKNEFLDKADWVTCGGYRYLDGLKLAAKLGLDIQPVILKRSKVRQVVKILKDEVQDES